MDKPKYLWVSGFARVGNADLASGGRFDRSCWERNGGFRQPAPDYPGGEQGRATMVSLLLRIVIIRLSFSAIASEECNHGKPETLRCAESARWQEPRFQREIRLRDRRLARRAPRVQQNDRGQMSESGNGHPFLHAGKAGRRDGSYHPRLNHCWRFVARIIRRWSPNNHSPVPTHRNAFRSAQQASIRLPN